MNTKEKLNSTVKEIIGVYKQLFTKIEFADAKLKDGTIVSAQSFEPGQDLFIIDESGSRIPAPDGEHILEDGSKVIVKDGKIESLTKLETEDAATKTPEDETEDAATKTPEDETEDAATKTPEDETEVEDGSLEELKQIIIDLVNRVNSMEMILNQYNMNTDKKIEDAVEKVKESFSKIPGGDKIVPRPMAEQTSQLTLTDRMRNIKNS